MYIDAKISALVFEYAIRGSLQDIIGKEKNLGWDYKWSMFNDLCRGMRYLHQSPLKFHGTLKSNNCVVDSRWVLKITDFGILNIYSIQKMYPSYSYSDLLWTAPEHLRQGTPVENKIIIKTGSQQGDVYAFGIIMQELIQLTAPFGSTSLTSEEIINKIKKPPPLLRPSVSKGALEKSNTPFEYFNIMRDCWSEQPDMRPTFVIFVVAKKILATFLILFKFMKDRLLSQFKSLNGDRKVNIVDIMFRQIQAYTNDLEGLIQEKTIKLEEEKKRTDELLSEMLPK